MRVIRFSLAKLLLVDFPNYEKTQNNLKYLSFFNPQICHFLTLERHMSLDNSRLKIQINLQTKLKQFISSNP